MKSLLLFPIAIFALSGCSLIGKSICDPQKDYTCPCDDGSTGSQLCTPDGERFEPCQCANECGGVPVEGGCRLLIGECGKGKPVCEGAQWQCNFPTTVEENETLCDGLDNDCDGDVDEADDLPDNDAHCGGCNKACARGTVCKDKACTAS